MSKTLPFPQAGASDGVPPPGPATPLPGGSEVAHLVINRVLNEGSHNFVYLAHDGLSDASGAVALMEYFPRALALRQPDGTVRARQAGDAIALSVAREAFVQDAVALQQIDHPNLVRVLGTVQAHRTVYRAMQYVEGPTLERQVLGREGPAQVGDVVRLLEALLGALDALHRAGVIHGNVRPDQILLAGGRIDRPVLLGMGSAAAEIAGHRAGPWAAPEQSAASRHDRINSATDLYMLATTAWFAATGDEPPALRDRLAQPEAWDPREALAELTEQSGDTPGAKAWLVRTLAASLELLPSARPQRVDDFRSLLYPSAARTRFEYSGGAPLWVGPLPDREAQWEVVEAAARGVPPSPRPAAARSRLAEREPAPRSGTSTMDRTPPQVDASVPLPPQRESARAPAPLPRTEAAAPEAVADHRQDQDTRGAPVRFSWFSRWQLAAVLVVGVSLAVGAWFMLRPALQLPVATVPPQEVAPVADGASRDAVLRPASPGEIAAPPVGPTADQPAYPASSVSPAVSAVTSATVATPLAATTITVPTAVQPSATTAATSGGVAASAAASRSATTHEPSSQPAPSRGSAFGTLCGNSAGFALAYCLQEECVKPVNRSHPRCVEWRRSTEAAR